MVKAKVYVEGGGDSKEVRIRCREGFTKLLEHCGYRHRMPRVVASGGRNQVFDAFQTAHRQGGYSYVAMWIDSEEPLADCDITWAHLGTRDGWKKPDGSDDEQVLFMTTCMETYFVADRVALRQRFHSELEESALPAVDKLELRDRHSIQNALCHATRNCSAPYSKGKRSFMLLGIIDPNKLEQYLPSFARARKILNKKLKVEGRLS